jgi:hypothetical protein
MRNTRVSGILLLAGAVGGLVVMLTHPTGHDLMSAAEPARRAAGNVAVHSLALATLPALFLGLWGLGRLLAPSDLGRAALVLYGFGALATVPAAVMSGFVATDLILGMHGADAASRELAHGLLRFSLLLNRGFYSVGVVAVSLSLLLWSAAILRGRRLPRSVAAAGLVVGAAIPAALVSGHLGLGLHGFAVITLGQSAWFAWVGILLLRGPAGTTGTTTRPLS